MKLVVGLGNPGRRYQGTRHNIGYAVLAELARKFGQPAQGTVSGRGGRGRPGAAQKALLLSPTTYMNLSGASVLAAMTFTRYPTKTCWSSATT